MRRSSSRPKNMPIILIHVLAALGCHSFAGEIFVESAISSGLKFNHFNGMVGDLYILEEMGPGCALFDYDNDGDLDVYLVQGHLLGRNKTMSDAVFPSQEPLPTRDRLFRNDLTVGADSSRRLSFTDVTEASGIMATGYGIGVAVCDINNDGWLDILVLNYGSNQLWRNNGDGTFDDITKESNLTAIDWSVSASFADYDQDGNMDLYIANYVHFSDDLHKVCTSATGYVDYCGPSSYLDQKDRLYRNLGGGVFEDVSQKAGIHGVAASGLGVIAADFNGDRLLDFYVANDADPNFLWLNQGNGQFIDDGIIAGCAVNLNGATEASMGVDAADIDGDGDQDLFMTHLNGETNTLFRNEGQGIFRDVTLTVGLGASSLHKTGFGTAWIDYDNDGQLDLFIANGAVNMQPDLVKLKDPFPLHQSDQLYRANSDGTFEELNSGAYFSLSEVGRGVAIGDIDNDGDCDVLVANNSGPARLLLNQVGQKNSWLGVHCKSTKGVDVTQTRVRLTQTDRPPIWRRVRVDGSYSSSHDGRLLFGLGSNSKSCNLEVHWPNGQVEHWKDVKPNQYVSLTQGEGSKE